VAAVLAGVPPAPAGAGAGKSGGSGGLRVGWLFILVTVFTFCVSANPIEHL